MSYGFDAYLSVWQWRVIFVLDVLIKSSLIYLSAAVTTLGLIITSGFEPIVPIILVGISISSLHFLCLYFAIRFIEQFKLNHVESNLARFALLLLFSNILFVAILTVVLSVNGGIRSNAILSMLVAATNLIPVLPVALIAGISRLIIRPR
jgi:hypothetical protein